MPFGVEEKKYHDLTPVIWGHVFLGSNFTKMAISFVLFVIEHKFWCQTPLNQVPAI